MSKKLKAAALTALFFAFIVGMITFGVFYTKVFMMIVVVGVVGVILILSIAGIYESFLELFEEDES